MTSELLFPPALSLVLALVPAQTAAGGEGFTAFFGQEDSPGNVQQVVPGQPPSGPPELQGVHLLGIELSGRTLLHALRPTHARLRLDIPGAARLLLPQSQGSLYRYERNEPDGSVTFGFFVVDPGGAPRSVLEVPGTGSDQDADPFVAKVAVGPAGLGMLVATTRPAGGDLLEVDLGSGAVQNRTSNLPPLDLTANGLALGATWGTAATQQGVLRFDRSSAGDATWLPLPTAAKAGTKLPSLRGAPKGVWYSGEVVTSNNGQYAATVAGPSPTLAYVYVYSASGPARRVNQKPAYVSPAGFLPEHQDGPFWAVSDDGSCCAWRVEGSSSRELYMARTQPLAPGDAPVHVTQDACFHPFLDEVGQFLFVDNTRLVAMIGDKTGASFILRWADVYQFQLGAPGAVPFMQNLTGTSGDAIPPYTAYGKIDPKGVYWLPDQAAFLLLDTWWNVGLEGAHLDTGGLTQLLPSAQVLDAVERNGSQVVVSVQFPVPPGGTGSDSVQIHSLDESLSVPAAMMFDLGDYDDPLPRAGGPTGLSFVVFQDDTVGDLWRMDPVTGAMEMLSATPLPYGPALDVTPAGTTFAVVDYDQSSASFVQWLAGSQVSSAFAAGSEAFVLPRR